jgi:hypothetical protein
LIPTYASKHKNKKQYKTRNCDVNNLKAATDRTHETSRVLIHFIDVHFGTDINSVWISTFTHCTKLHQKFIVDVQPPRSPDFSALYFNVPTLYSARTGNEKTPVTAKQFATTPGLRKGRDSPYQM